MNRIWAPWRIEYIESEKEDACIFCTAGEKDHEESLLLHSSPDAMVMLNRYPYNSGHIMVAPSRHVADIAELTPGESTGIMSMLARSKTALAGAMKPDGFNVGANLGSAAGAGIADHLHFHIVPRWNGDTNFMPVFADIKVMPEHLAGTWRKLAPYFTDHD